MDAKRRRLLSSSPSHGKSSPARSSSASRDTVVTPLNQSILPPIDLLSSDDLLGIDLALSNLRKILISKEAISWFISIDDRLASLIRLLHRASSSVASPDSGWSTVLRSLVSILGNMCNFSMRVCFELSQPRVKFADIATRLLESGTRTCVQTKASILRVAGNLCQKKESARSIASHGSLIDRIALMMEDENEAIITHSFRCIRLLVERSFHRVVLLSNGGFYLGKLLLSVFEDEKKANPVISTLAALTQFSAKDTGRQLATSECTPVLLANFLSPSVHQSHKDLLLALAVGSTDIRDRLGEADVIAKLTRGPNEEGEEGVQWEVTEQERCTLLATFTQDAWGRASLRESGALDILIDRLAQSTLTTEKAAILVAFRHLVHDTTSMAYLCRSKAFLDSVIANINEYVECYGAECEPISIREEKESTRPWSPLLVEPESRQERRHITEKRAMEGLALSLSYSDRDSYRMAHSPLSSSSPPSSPSSPISLSPTHSFSLSPPSSSHQSPSYDSDLSNNSPRLLKASQAEVESTVDREDEDTEKERKLMKQVVDNELWLVGWQANEDANLPYLMREDLVTCLLSLLRLVSPHSIRLGRPLKRMATSRHSIEGLLDMHFHSRIFHSLCTPPCRLSRFARRCRRCEQDAEFGSEILRDFSASVDSDFGHGFLMQRLSSEDRDVRVSVALAKISLIRNRFRLSRRISIDQSSPLEELLAEMKRILMVKNYDMEATRSLYEGGPPVGILIIGALSTLLDSSKMKDVFEVDSTWTAPEFTPCRVINDDHDDAMDESGPSTSGDKSPEEDIVTFEDSNGIILGRITLQNLREGSEYFNGMFSSDMVESIEKKRRFVFDETEDYCTREEFRTFLHCLANCSPARCLCTKVQCTDTCMTLIRLADKYLCSSLSQWILGPHGPARSLLDGNSLHLFMPLALHLYTHHKVMDACMVTLLRFSTQSNLSQTLAAIAGDTVAVDNFIDRLAAFVQTNSLIPLNSASPAVVPLGRKLVE